MSAGTDPDPHHGLLQTATPREQRTSVVAQLVSLVGPGGSPATTLEMLAAVRRLELEFAMTSPVIRGVISDLTWQDRRWGNPLAATDHYLESEWVRSDQVPTLYVYYYVTQRLRFDFKFDKLRAELRRYRPATSDPQLDAMRVLADMGLHRSDASAEYQAYWDEHARDDVALDILLQALWFGTHIDHQADEIIKLSDDMLALGLAGPNVYFRRAFAFRRKGDFDTAMREILQAIDLLEPGEIAVHQDYAREREMISSTAIMQEQLTTAVSTSVSAAIASLEERAKAAEDDVSRSLMSLVEVLGIFIALVGFLGAGAVTLFQQMSVGEKILVLVLIFVGSIGFITTLRFIVRAEYVFPSRRRRDRTPPRDR